MPKIFHQYLFIYLFAPAPPSPLVLTPVDRGMPGHHDKSCMFSEAGEPATQNVKRRTTDFLVTECLCPLV